MLNTFILVKQSKDIEQDILREIEKEGGALGMKNLRSIEPDAGKLKAKIDDMVRRNILFVHEDGDIYTHRPEDVSKGCECGHCLGVGAAFDFLEKKLCPAGKAAAKRKFKVYPSAYANGWAVQYCKGKFRKKKGKKK